MITLILGDADRKRAFQITADKSGDKVQVTLNAYVNHNLQKQYGTFRSSSLATGKGHTRAMKGKYQDRYQTILFGIKHIHSEPQNVDCFTSFRTLLPKYYSR